MTVVPGARTPPGTVDLTRGTLRGPCFRAARGALLALLVPLLRLRIEGMEHVPRSGPVVVVANHLHNADPVVLSVAFPRPLHFMTKKEAFANPFTAAIARRVGAFPVDRGKADRGAIRHAEAALAQGIAVGIFPEGTRSVTQALRRAYPGAALIALRSGAPVLPVAITGTEWLPFNGSKGRPPRRTSASRTRPPGVRVCFGPPFVLSREEQKLSTETATDRIMAEIAALLPAAYRGDYATAGEPHPTTNPAVG